MRASKKGRWLTLLLVSATFGCIPLKEDALPPVHQAAVEPPAACVAAPPLPPFAEPTERASDAEACLRAAWTGGRLPVELKIVDGRVVEFRFHEPCALRDDHEIDVPGPVRDCIQQSLSTWRYAVPICAGHPSVSSAFITLGLPEQKRLERLGRPGADIMVAEWCR
jgi:hypothetical protein